MGWVVIMGECPLGDPVPWGKTLRSDPGSGGVWVVGCGLGSWSLWLSSGGHYGVLIVGYWSLVNCN